MAEPVRKETNQTANTSTQAANINIPSEFDQLAAKPYKAGQETEFQRLAKMPRADTDFQELMDRPIGSGAAQERLQKIKQAANRPDKPASPTGATVLEKGYKQQQQSKKSPRMRRDEATLTANQRYNNFGMAARSFVPQRKKKKKTTAATVAKKSLARTLVFSAGVHFFTWIALWQIIFFAFFVLFFVIYTVVSEAGTLTGIAMWGVEKAGGFFGYENEAAAISAVKNFGIGLVLLPWALAALFTTSLMLVSLGILMVAGKPLGLKPISGTNHGPFLISFIGYAVLGVIPFPWAVVWLVSMYKHPSGK